MMTVGMLQLLVGAIAIGTSLIWTNARRPRTQPRTTPAEAESGESVISGDPIISIESADSQGLNSDALLKPDPRQAITTHAPREKGISYIELKPDEIRILEILDEGGRNGFRCKLRHCLIGNTATCTYTALSYHWGTNHATFKVTINGDDVAIPVNLYRALQELSKKGYNTLWVDAICINQHNEAERNFQVGRIGTIFSQAERVVAWLGEEDESTRRIMTVMTRWLRDTTRASPVSLRLNMELYNNGDVLDFVRRPFWKRVWILQELVKATKVVFLCCGEEIGFEEIDCLVKETEAKIERSEWPDFAESLRYIHEIFNIRGLQSRNLSLGLLEALVRTEAALSSERHDKVFGLLGLVHDRSLFFSQTLPNYGLSTETMSMKMTHSCISEQQRLDIILTNPRNRYETSLPSWCPDYFHLDSQMLDAHLINYLHGKGEQYRLGERHRSWSTTGLGRAIENKTFRIQENVLRVEAAKIGDVGSVMALYGGAYRTRGQALWKAASADSHPESGRECIQPCLPKPDKYSVFDGLARMLLLYHPRYSSFTEASLAPNLLYDTSYRLYVAKHKENHEVQAVYQWLRDNADFEIEDRKLEDQAYWNWHVGKNWFKAWSSTAHMNTIFEFGSLSHEVFKIVNEKLHLVTLRHGQLAWAERWTRLEDEIWMLAGCSVPVVLRPQPGTPGSRVRYTVIGRAYVDGFMDGSKWKQCQDAKPKNTHWIDIG